MEPTPMKDRLLNDYKYHSPKENQITRYQEIRDTAHAFATLVTELTPASREQSIALTNIEAAVMYANAAIARNE